ACGSIMRASQRSAVCNLVFAPKGQFVYYTNWSSFMKGTLVKECPMRLCAALLLVAGLIAGPARAEDDKEEEKAPAKLTAVELAAKIDAALNAKIKVRKAKAAPAADDSELVRRMHLDISGRIPDLMTARDYIDNPEKDKRAKLIDTLLADDRYSVHWANIW